MSLEDTLTDLHTVLEADIFTSDENGLGTRSLPDVYRKVEDMRDLLRRDRQEIRHAQDVMNIKYKNELVGWLTQAGNYLNLRQMDVQRFNNSYENMLAYYAGRVIDHLSAGENTPLEVGIAQNRFMKYKERIARGIAL